MRAALLYQAPAPVGDLTLIEEDGALREVVFGTARDACFGQTPLLARARDELDAYFAGQLRAFTLPLRPSGTPFQLRCWQALCDVPYGGTISYGELAARVGNAKASRAVGMANHRNPLPILIPCHRVIGADGSMTGYGGGLAVKEYLLRLEREGMCADG